VLLTCDRCRDATEVPDDGGAPAFVCPDCVTPDERRARSMELEKLRFVARLYRRTDPAYSAHLLEGVELVEELDEQTLWLQADNLSRKRLAR